MSQPTTAPKPSPTPSAISQLLAKAAFPRSADVNGHTGKPGPRSRPRCEGFVVTWSNRRGAVSVEWSGTRDRRPAMLANYAAAIREAGWAIETTPFGLTVTSPAGLRAQSQDTDPKENDG